MLTLIAKAITPSMKKKVGRLTRTVAEPLVAGGTGDAAGAHQREGEICAGPCSVLSRPPNSIPCSTTEGMMFSQVIITTARAMIASAGSRGTS